jgi:separase
MSPERLQLFRGKIEKVFNLALFGSAHDSKKHGKVHLSDALLECFATLSSKSRDEEIEDFVYFILDIYQFHGVPVAVAELDLDQVNNVASRGRDVEADKTGWDRCRYRLD